MYFESFAHLAGFAIGVGIATCIVSAVIWGIGLFKSKREVAAMEKRVDIKTSRILEALCEVESLDEVKRLRRHAPQAQGYQVDESGNVTVYLHQAPAIFPPLEDE